MPKSDFADYVIHDLDNSNRKDYEKAGSEPFTYEGAKRKLISLSYWQVPPHVMEDRETIVQWVDKFFIEPLTLYR